MKLFVTDYDDTLYTSDQSIIKNIEMFNKLKEHNFLIMISTGRSYPSIKKQINTYNIIYDFISCADGSIIYDKNKNIIYKDALNPKIINDFIKFYQTLNYEEIQFSYPKGYQNILGNTKNLLGINICLSNDNYNQDTVNKFYKLKEKYPNYNYLCYKHPNFSYLCIKPKDISKSYAITYLINKLKIKKEDVYVIGDSSNDFEMIKDYHGVGMYNSCDEILSIVNKTYSEVSDYSIDILKEN